MYVNFTLKTILQFYSLVKMLQPPAFSTKGGHLNLHRQIFVTNHVHPHLMVAIEEEKKFLSHKKSIFLFDLPLRKIVTEDDLSLLLKEGILTICELGKIWNSCITLEFHRSRRKWMILVGSETPK